MRVHRSVLALCLGHFCVDSYSSMLGAFLPFLQQRLHLSLAEAGMLASVLSLSASVVQPIYGYLADWSRHRAFAVLGPAVAGVFISSLGLAHDFGWLAVLLVLGGAGVAAFHPQGAAITTEACSERHAYHMSIFVTAGTLGYALGPVYITSLITSFGLDRSYWAALPGVLLSIYLFRRGPRPELRTGRRRQGDILSMLRQQLKPLATLYFLVVIRAVVAGAFSSFLALYFTGQGYSEMRASQYLTAFLLAAGVSGFCGGVLADRLGHRRIIALSMIGSLPLFLGFLWSKGAWSVVFLILAGSVLSSTTPVNVVMAQKLVPKGSSTVSALMMGFAWGLGGLFIPLVGWASDHFGLSAALAGLTLLTLPGFGLSLLLPPDPENGRRPAIPNRAADRARKPTPRGE